MRTTAPTSLASIVGLLLRGGPSAIVGSVAKIVVDAIDRMSWRAGPHVGDEMRELFPSLTDRDAATAIVSKSVVVWIQASAAHLQPRLITALATYSSGKSMLQGSPHDDFSFQASTALADTRAEVVATDRRRVAAVASADPHNASFPVRMLTMASVLCYGPTVKPLADEIGMGPGHHSILAEAPPTKWRSGSAPTLNYTP